MKDGQGNVSILCLDGSGVRGFSTLLVLKQIMVQINTDRSTHDTLQPWQVFDLIGGTSTGGLIAIMLGRLRMTVDDCERAYIQVMRKLYETKLPPWDLRRILGNPSLDSKVYEDAIKEVIENSLAENPSFCHDRETNDSNLPFSAWSGICKFVEGCKFPRRSRRCRVCVLTAVVNESDVSLLRSYKQSGMKDYLSESMEVWQACRATSAASSYFTPFRHTRSGLKFIDPIKSHEKFLPLALSEARKLWPDRAAIIINIGPRSQNLVLPTEQQNGFLTNGFWNQNQCVDRYSIEISTSDQFYHLDVEKYGGTSLDDYDFFATLGSAATQIHIRSSHLHPLSRCAEELSRPWRLSKDDIACIESLTFSEINNRRDAIPDAVEHTCDWLFDDPSFQEWKGNKISQQSTLFWVKGKPGSGKSTLMKFLLKDQKRKASLDSIIASFFFNFSGVSLERSVEGMLRCLLCQILEQKQSESSTYLLNQLYCYNEKSFGTEWLWDVRDLTDCLFWAVANPERGPMYLFIDGLDECDQVHHQTLANMLETLITKSRSLGQLLYLAVSSRPSFNLAIDSCYSIFTEDENSKDLETFARAMLGGNPFELSRALQEQLVLDTARRAEGMFLWVNLVVRELLSNREQVTTTDAFKKLQSIPCGLEDLYEYLLGRITKEYGSNALRISRSILQWVSAAARPLSLQELRYAISFDEDMLMPLTADDTFNERYLSESCGFLVEITPTQTVQLIHYSTKEYLLNGTSFMLGGNTFWGINSTIAMICLEYLASFDDESHIEHSSFDHNLQLLKSYEKPYASTKAICTGAPHLQLQVNSSLTKRPFLKYAVLHCFEHARLGESTDGHSSAALLPWFQKDCGLHFKKWKVWNADFVSLGIQRGTWEGPDATPLQTAAARNLLGLTEALCRGPANVDVGGGTYITPLWAAARFGHKQVVEVLLEAGADVNASDAERPGQSALSIAAKRGHVEIVELLLTYGARIYAEDGASCAMLWKSIVTWPDYSTLSIMLRHGLNSSERISDGKTALLYLLEEQPRWGSQSHRKAAKAEMVELLISSMKPEALNAMDDAGHTALSYGTVENLLPCNASSKYMVRDQIFSVLRELGAPKSRIINVLCEANWEVLEYFRSEFPERKELSSIFTLTGSIAEAQGTTCGDYMRQRWPATGSQLLQAFEVAIKSQECRLTFKKNHNLWAILHPGDRQLDKPESASIQVRGTVSEVTETLEQLAWLGATFRLPLPGKLTMSYIQCSRPSRNGVKQEDKSEGLAVGLRLELLSARHQDPEPGQVGTCWAKPLSESILARGFAVAPRDDVKGLEISTSTMLALAGVQNVETHDHGLFFLGESSMIYPTAARNDSVQWHFVEAEDKATLLRILRKSPNRLYTVDLTRLMSSRSFLGVYGVSQVHLGTRQALRQGIKDSGLPSTRQQFELVKEGTFGVGIKPPVAPLSLNIGLKARLAPRQIDRIPGRTIPYRDRLARAMQQPTLMYDANTDTAWMVSQLSVILHLVLSYLLKREKMLSLSAKHHLPYADPSADGGGAAFRAIHEVSEMKLWTEKGEKEPLLVRNIVEQFLDVLESREWDSRLKDMNAGFKFQSGLTGWDFKELDTLKNLVSPRTLSRTHKATWWRLVKDSGMLVIFCFDFGQIICADKSRMKVCSAWGSIPAGKHLLAVTVPVLKCLAELQNQDESCHLLTKKIRWRRPPRSRLFQECNEFCNPVQELCKQKLMLIYHGACVPPGQLCEEGAVVFGVHDEFCPRIACRAMGLEEAGWIECIFALLEAVIAIIVALYFKRVLFALAFIVVVWRMYCLFVVDIV